MFVLFFQNGHEVHLYVYSDVANIPPGIIVKDGNEILPENMIFLYKDHKSFSGFSNYFRYKLLLDKGGYWVDTDMVCLKPFNFFENFVFSSEDIPPFDSGNQHINAGVIKIPQNSPVAQHMFDVCMSKDRKKLKWGEIGPSLVKQTVEKFNLQFFVQDYKVFCPIAGCNWSLLLNPNNDISIGEDVYGIHLWNEMWRRDNIEKSNTFDDNCLYEILKKKYL